jgi:hypothetical protein
VDPTTRASVSPPGNPRPPSTKAICTAFQVSPGAAAIGPIGAAAAFAVGTANAGDDARDDDARAAASWNAAPQLGQATD